MTPEQGAADSNADEPSPAPPPSRDETNPSNDEQFRGRYIAASKTPSMIQMQKAAMLGDFLRQNDDLISPWKFPRHILIGRAIGRLNRGWGEAGVKQAQSKP